MLIGEVDGPDGKKHTVSYTSHAQNDQIIVLVDPAPLAVEPMRKSVKAEAGSTVLLPVKVSRGAGVQGAVRLELVTPEHLSAVRCDPVVAPADASEVQMRIRFDASLGPLNMPVTIRATTLDGPSLTAEAKLEL